MAVGNVIFLAFMALVAVNFIFADEVDFSESASRKERSANDEEAQERFFFNIFPTVTSCNYSVNPGSYCASSTQAVRCLPNNVGILRNCRGLLRYCNNGRCSLFPAPASSGNSTG